MTQKYLLSFPDLTLNLDIIPDINDILPAFTNPFSLPEWAWSDLGFPFPPTFALPDLPDLPSFPSDYSLHLPTMDFPSWSACEAAGAVVIGQITSVLDFIISKLKIFGALFPLSGILPITYPQWPGFSGSPGFDLSDIMAPSPLAFLDHMRLPDFDFSLIPNLPELWPSMSTPDMSSFHALQVAITNYAASLLQTITTLFNKVISYFASIEVGIPAFPSLPTIPSLSQIMDMLPDAPTLDDLNNLFAGGSPGFSLPGWGAFSFSLPTPLIPDLSMPEFDFTFGISQMFIAMVGFVLSKIVNWINVIPLISAIIGVFPKIVDMIGDIPPFGDVCHESVTSGIPCFT